MELNAQSFRICFSIAVLLFHNQKMIKIRSAWAWLQKPCPDLTEIDHCTKRKIKFLRNLKNMNSLSSKTSDGMTKSMELVIKSNV